MPEVIVKAGTSQGEDAPVLLRERVSDRNLDSPHYTEQLIERIGWAVVDAAQVEADQADERPA